MKRKNRKFHFNRAIDFLILALIVIGLYCHVIRLWWTYDDTQILKYAILYSPLQYFFDPLIWQEFTPRFLTPLLLLSFDTDIFLFGLSPQWFYIHHITVIWLCSVMVYLILKKWLRRPFAFLGACLFLLGSPVAVIAQQLMTRHYAEGLLFALIALYLFLRGLEERNIRWVCGSALAYALAMAAKEVYVPFALLLIALPQGEWRQRLKYALPHFVMLLLYVPWRFWMLGTLWGGYDTHISAKNVILLPYNAVRFFGQASPLDIAAGVTLLSALLLFIAKNPKRGPFILWAGILILFPLLPVAHAPAPRFFLVVWLTAVFLLIFMARFFWGKGSLGKLLSVVLFFLILLQTAHNGRREWRDNLAVARQLSAEGSFIFSGAGKDDLLRLPAFEAHFFKGIQWLKHNYYGIDASGMWFYDDVYLCEHDLSDKRIWQYVAPQERLLDITGSIESIATAYCGRIRYDAPLSIRARYSKSMASWELGPYHDGQYAFLTDDGAGKMVAPPAGSLRINFEHFVKFRIRYESPEGWVTYSPDLTVGIQERKTEICWERAGARKGTL